MMVCGVRFLCIILVCIFIGTQCSVISSNKRKIQEVELKEQLRLLFEIIDINRDGLMDAKELIGVCLENNIDIEETKAELTVTLPDKTVGLTMDMFIELLAHCPSSKTEDILVFLLHGDLQNRQGRIGIPIGVNFQQWKTEVLENVFKKKFFHTWTRAFAGVEKPLHAAARVPDALVQIAQVIKKTLKNKSNNEIMKMMKDHFIIMKLINEKNIWASGKLENIGHKLLPGNLTSLDLCDFVDKMARHAAENNYLVDFLTQIPETTYSRLKELVQSEGDRIVPDVVVFAMVLDRLTVAQKEDWRVMQACQEVWDGELTLENIKSVTSPFELAKALSIDETIEKMLETLEESEANDGNIEPLHYNDYRGNSLLSANIIEAAAEDLRLGFLANARTAWTLVQSQPEDVTGEDPIRVSEDGKAIESHFPLGKEWADLYQTWNLAFVSHYPQFPYFFAKLLIPSVGDYQAAPELYLHNRMFAIHNFINWGLLWKIHDSFNNSHMNWFNREVTNNWGKRNLQSSQDYDLKLTGWQ